MRLTIDEFRARPLDFERSAFRFDTLPHYAGDSERAGLALFLSGQKKPERHNANTHDTVRRAIADGKSWTKVKLVRRPFSDYTRYSLEWIIPGNAAAGWEHRIIDATERDFDLPDFDFWLYDDSTVIVVNYDQDGVPESADLTEGDDVEQYRQWWDIAMRESGSVQ